MASWSNIFTSTNLLRESKIRLLRLCTVQNRRKSKRLVQQAITMCGALMVTAYPIPCGASMYGLFLQNKPRSIAFIAAAIRGFFKMPLAVCNTHMLAVWYVVDWVWNILWDLSLSAWLLYWCNNNKLSFMGLMALITRTEDTLVMLSDMMCHCKTYWKEEWLANEGEAECNYRWWATYVKELAMHNWNSKRKTDVSERRAQWSDGSHRPAANTRTPEEVGL